MRQDIIDTEILVTIIEDGKQQDDLSLFYTSKEWRRLRRKVMQTFKYECQPCKERGTYVKAEILHHHREVRDYPALALSEYYKDGKGEQQRNLIPVCDDCHKAIHNKSVYTEPLTLERW